MNRKKGRKLGRPNIIELESGERPQVRCVYINRRVPSLSCISHQQQTGPRCSTQGASSVSYTVIQFRIYHNRLL